MSYGLDHERTEGAAVAAGAALVVVVVGVFVVVVPVAKAGEGCMMSGSFGAHVRGVAWVETEGREFNQPHGVPLAALDRPRAGRMMHLTICASRWRRT
jgi:hypothetical protein